MRLRLLCLLFCFSIPGTLCAQEPKTADDAGPAAETAALSQQLAAAKKALAQQDATLAAQAKQIAALKASTPEQLVARQAAILSALKATALECPPKAQAVAFGGVVVEGQSHPVRLCVMAMKELR